MREIGIYHELLEGVGKRKRKASSWYYLSTESGDFDSAVGFIRKLVGSTGKARFARLNSEFYDQKLLIKCNDLKIRHYSDNLDVFHDYMYFINYLFAKFDSVLYNFLYV
jgi:hypothetical protein